MRTPEFGWVVGDSFRPLCDARGVGLKEKVLELPHVTVRSDVLASVPERGGGPGSVLLQRGLPEELDSFLLEPQHCIPWNAVAHDLEEPELLASFHDGLRQLGPRDGEVDGRDPDCPSFPGPDVRA